MGPRVTLTAHAYACATLHAVAHPTCSVNGVLLGPPLAAADTAQGGDAGGPVTHVTAAVPLFHSNLGLAPMYDVALALVRPGPALRQRCARTCCCWLRAWLSICSC